MAQDETRATSVAPAPKEVEVPTDPSTAVRTLSILHTLHLVADDPELLIQRLAAHRQAQRVAADAALAALPAETAERVRGALDTSLQPGEDDGAVQAALATGTGLAEAYAALHDAYDTMLAAMAVQGRQALSNAVRYGGRERAEELKDAQRLLHGVLEHPIGARNYGVWFEYGWALLQSEADLAQAEEAFYQAQRLSVVGDVAYHALALRYLASVQSLQGRDADALATVTRLEKAATPDAATWIETARYSLRTGNDERAVALVDTAFALDTTTATLVLADHDLAPLHATVAGHLVAHTDDARRRAEEAGRRLTRIRRLVGDVETRLSIQIPAPDGEPEQVDVSRLGLNRALARAAQAESDGDALAVATRGALDAEANRAQGEIDRLEKFLAQAVRECGYWERSVRNLEEEAQLAGFSLHPYTFNNPFKRRQNVRAEQARHLYEQCKANHAQSEAFVASQQGRIDSEVARYKQRLETIAELRLAADSIL